MNNPSKISQSQFREKRSKFIGIMIPVKTEEEISKRLRTMKKQYRDATHICYAYRCYLEETGEIAEGKSDAGEPLGTAGQPILFHLQQNQIVNALLLVVRYFGGIKLGRSGLARAYGNTAALVINDMELTSFIPTTKVCLEVPYGMIGITQNIIRQFEGKVLHRDYDEKTKLLIQIPTEKIDEFQNYIITESGEKIQILSQ